MYALFFVILSEREFTTWNPHGGNVTIDSTSLSSRALLETQ
jgi:hypothetical protein